jgi:hypothetical protein
MTKTQLIVALMILVGVIIVSIAAYVFTHLSGITMTTAIVLVSIAVISLFIIMGVILILMKSLIARK